jgi:hypothetical protein
MYLNIYRYIHDLYIYIHVMLGKLCMNYTIISSPSKQNSSKTYFLHDEIYAGFLESSFGGFAEK